MGKFTYKIGAQGAHDRAKQFMGNDIVRGIVELITNSDAAYSQLGLRNLKRRPIMVSVNPSERWFEVKDRAGGMSPDVISEKFTEGGATSAEGQRGYFGLGAKDCAVFGSLVLKTIDSARTLTEVNIPGNFEDCNWDSRKATEQDYKDMHGTPRNLAGTVIRIYVDKQESGGARIPRFETLEKYLRTHYALRRLHQRNKVTLRMVGRRKGPSQNLVYPGFPWEIPTSECVYDGVLEVAGYSGSQPSLILYKLPDPVEGDPGSEGFEGFIQVGTADVADYGFTLAGLEKREHAKRLVGLLDDAYIQTLLNEYRSSGQSEQNPRPVVSQDRRPRNGGLDSDHPYAKALLDTLRSVVQTALESLQSESRESARSDISEALQAANDEAGRRISQMLDAEGSTSSPKPLPEGFYFLPSSKALRRANSDWESLSLYSIGIDEVAEDSEVHLQFADRDVCDVESHVVNPRPRPGGKDGYRASIKLRAGSMLGQTTLSASLNGRTAEASVSVVDTPPPLMLVQFERPKYTVQPSRRRTVKVLVPENLIDDMGEATVKLSMSDSGGGVVIQGQSSHTVFDCEFDSDRLAYVVPFSIEGRQVGAKAKLTATFQTHKVGAEITVGGGSLHVFVDDNETSPPDQRAKVFGVDESCSQSEHRNELCLHVFARHPRIDRYLGEATLGQNGSIFWDLNDSPGFRAMYADCVAEAVAQFQMLDSGANYGESTDDFFDSFWKAKKRSLAIMQQVYIDDIKWKAQEELHRSPK